MWSGVKASGRIAGGGWWRAECSCGAWLQAYWDVYGDDDEVIRFPDGYEPELVWRRWPEDQKQAEPGAAPDTAG